MADEAFLHGLLKDASQSFAAKAKERNEAKTFSPTSQAKLKQSLGIKDEETPNHEHSVQVTSTTTVVAPAKEHDNQVTKLPDSSLAKTNNSGSGSNEQGQNSVGFTTFTYTDAVAIFFMHHRAFRGARPVRKNKTDNYDRLAVSAVVFNRDEDKVLLVQCAGTDLQGGKWETPGAVCENRDVTILHGLVRELYEGTGLAAKKVIATTGYNDLTIPSGPRCRKYAFIVELGTYRAVSLNPDKYLRFVWASERDIAMGWCEGHHLEFTGAEERLHIVRAFQEKEEAEEGR